MKKIFFILILLLGAAYSALAVPAAPGNYRRVQPDGSVIILQNHGDEYFNWITDQNGRIVEKKADGFYREVDMPTHIARREKAMAARPVRRWSSYEDAPVTNFGDRKVLCIIANFTDSTFVIDNPNLRFSNLLNQEGYSYNGSIGSVRDYYLDNSLGLYRPQFDVYGPVNLSQSSAWYDANGAHNAIMEAYELMADQIPIDDYDTDGDGVIDMVLFYYPGHNQAEQAGEESIWPHQSTGNFGYMGSKLFRRYFCTSELRGYRGADMCNIGTTCHEFAHSLGLPDFYDTDYEKNGYNDQKSIYFDLMAGGNYLFEGQRPPYLNALERNMLGWMPYPEELPDGDFTLTPIRDNKAYKVSARNDGEFFLLESRDNYKWDSGIERHFGDQQGLLIYHVDMSDRYIEPAAMTAKDLWSTNKLNAYGGYTMFWAEQASDNQFVYPGQGNVTRFRFIGWDKVEIGTVLSNISFDGSQSSFSCVHSTERIVYGIVKDSYNRPLEGAQVILAKSAHHFARIGLEQDLVVTTDGEGYYELTLPEGDASEFIVTACMEGYTPVSVNLKAENQFTHYDIILPRLDEGVHTDLQRFDSSLSLINYSFGMETLGVAMAYKPEDIAALGIAGTRLESIAFMANAATYEKVYIFVDIPDRTPTVIDVTNNYTQGMLNRINVAEHNIFIPADSRIVIGYGFTGLATSGEYQFSVFGPQTEANDGDWGTANFLADPIKWGSFNWGTDDLGNPRYFSFVIWADVSQIQDADFAALGAAYISVKDGVPSVVASLDRTVYQTEWFLDGNAVDTPPATGTLSEGPHTYMARITYYDGTVERVYLDIE